MKKLKIGYASRDQAAQQATRWTKAQIRCRAIRHAWDLASGHMNVKYGVSTQHFYCLRGCGVAKRIEFVTATGELLTSRMRYEDKQYLAEPGTGRISGEAADELRRLALKGSLTHKDAPSASAQKKLGAK